MRHLLQSFASTGTIQAINLLTGILVARLLLPEGRGELAIVLLWPNLMLTLGFLGLDQAVIYHSARKQRSATAVALAALLPGAGLLLLTALIGWFLLPWILAPEHEELIGLSRLFLLVSTPLHLLNNLAMAVLLGRQRVLSWNAVRLIQPSVYLCGLLLLWSLGAATVGNVLIAFMLAAGATLLASLPAAWSVLAQERAAADKPFAAVLGFAGRAHVESIFQLIARRIDQALISLFLPASDLGYYVVALALAGALEMAAGTVSIVAFPKISTLSTAEGKKVLLGRYFRFTLAVLAAGAVGLWLVGEVILVLLFGAAYQESGPLLRILVIAAALAGLSTCLAYGYKAHDRIGVINQGALLSALAAAPAFALLLPRYGLAGAAWATVIVQAVPFCFMLLRLRGALGISPLTLVRPTRDDAELLRRYRDTFIERLR